MNGSGDLHANSLLLELASVKVNGAQGEANVNVKAANASSDSSTIKNGSRGW